MDTHLQRVTLLGTEHPSPSVSRANIDGVLHVEPAALMFKSANGYASLAIPWDNIDRCDWDTADESGCLGLLWMLVWPLMIVTMGVLSPIYTYVWVTYWDEDFGTLFEVWFKVGGLHAKPEAIALARNIWNARGTYRHAIRDGHAIRHRGTGD